MINQITFSGNCGIVYPSTIYLLRDSLATTIRDKKLLKIINAHGYGGIPNSDVPDGCQYDIIRPLKNIVFRHIRSNKLFNNWNTIIKLYNSTSDFFHNDFILIGYSFSTKNNG